MTNASYDLFYVLRLRAVLALCAQFAPIRGTALSEQAWIAPALRRHFVDFHGEMLLLVHWSILAYTGLVKILKKHHKRTGLLVRAPHLDNLLSQPFCSVEVRVELGLLPGQPAGHGRLTVSNSCKAAPFVLLMASLWDV